MDTRNNLIIDNINHCYNNGKSINNFNLKVNSGEVVCILGPSGCGKTTLLRLIAGFEDPTSGQIEVGNSIVYGRQYVPTEKRSIGMLFQDIALFPHLSVKNNIGFSLNVKTNSSDKIIYNLLHKVGLEGFENRYADTMSGGEQQRVALARALANNPSVMLLDEPFASLDSWSKYDFAEDIINILKETNTPTIMVTHDPQEAMRLADRIIIMLDGQIIDEGTPSDLYFKAKHPFSVRLIGPVTDYTATSKNGFLNTPFGSLKIKQDMYTNYYEVLIRPDAFSIPHNEKEGIEINIESYKHIGALTEVEIRDKNNNKNIKLLIFSNIFNEIKKMNKLLFNKDWAFVFPKK